MINVGRLRKRINIYTWGESENELGQTTTELIKLKSTWAEIHPLKGKEYVEANMLQSETTYKVTLRYFKGLTEDMYIEYMDKMFSITSICDMEMRHKYYEVMCKEHKNKVEKKKDD